MTKDDDRNLNASNALSTASVVLNSVGIIVSLASIYLTVVQMPEALDAVGAIVSGTKIPPEFQGLAGRMQIFLLAFLIAISFFGLFVTVALSLRVGFILLGNQLPWHSSLFSEFGFVFVGLAVALVGISKFAVAFFLVLSFYCFATVLFLTSQPGIWDADLKRIKLGPDLGTMLGAGAFLSVIVGALVGGVVASERYSKSTSKSLDSAVADPSTDQ